jgi:hypothetical protein
VCHRLLSGSILVLGGTKRAPKRKGCKPYANMVQTKLLGLHGERFHVNVKGSM